MGLAIGEAGHGGQHYDVRLLHHASVCHGAAWFLPRSSFRFAEAAVVRRSGIGELIEARALLH